MLEFLAILLVLYFFWRQLLAVAIMAAVVVVPCLLAVLVYAYTLSGFTALSAALVAAYLCCTLIGEAADKFGS